MYQTQTSYTSNSVEYNVDAGPPCGCGKGCCEAGAAWRARRGL